MFKEILPAERRLALNVPWKTISLFDLMDELRPSPFELRFGEIKRINYPAVNINEDEHNIIVEAELPGIESTDIQLSLLNNKLVLQGEESHEKKSQNSNYQLVERSSGSFSRTIKLSSKVDENKVKASFKNGVLTVTLPKQNVEMGKKIDIES